MKSLTKNPYKSKLESTIAGQLKTQGVSFEYENMFIPYAVEHVYIPDFVLKSGIVIEAKGYFRPEDRRKHLCIQKQWPSLDVRFVFENAHKRLNKKSATTYAQWCDKHSLLWAHKSIPPKWTIK